MSTFLERYRNGDFVAVWRELIGLGAMALEPPLIHDATAVAEEIVRRIIHNANIVGAFLTDAGFDFAAPGPFVIPANAKTAKDVRQIEQEFGDLPLFLRVWWRSA